MPTQPMVRSTCFRRKAAPQDYNSLQLAWNPAEASNSIEDYHRRGQAVFVSLPITFLAYCNTSSHLNKFPRLLLLAVVATTGIYCLCARSSVYFVFGLSFAVFGAEGNLVRDCFTRASQDRKSVLANQKQIHNPTLR